MFLNVAFSTFLLAADLNQARTLLREGHVPEALREIDSALRDSPGNADVEFEVAEMLRELAGERAARLEELAPDSAEAKQLRGRALEAHGNLEEAVTAYRAALSMNPRMPGLHFLIGNIQWRKRDFEATKTEMEAELRLNTHHPGANMRLGQVLLAMDQPSPAAEHLIETIRADDSSLEAHRELGKAWRALGRYADALHEFQIVAKGNPQDSSVHAQLASVYRSLGQSDRAKTEMEAQRRLLQQKANVARKTSPDVP